jgi:hypothetical protein
MSLLPPRQNEEMLLSMVEHLHKLGTSASYNVAMKHFPMLACTSAHWTMILRKWFREHPDEKRHLAIDRTAAKRGRKRRAKEKAAKPKRVVQPESTEPEVIQALPYRSQGGHGMTVKTEPEKPQITPHEQLMREMRATYRRLGL